MSAGVSVLVVRSCTQRVFSVRRPASWVSAARSTLLKISEPGSMSNVEIISDLKQTKWGLRAVVRDSD